MKTNVTFRHFNAQHPDLHNLAMESAGKFTKFHDNIISTDFIFLNESDKVVEITLHVQGSTLVVKESSDEFKKSLAVAEDKMVRQIKKWKTKTIPHL